MSYSYEEMKKAKNWHHDIKKIGPEWIEDVVKKYQSSKDPILLDQIIENYSIFRPQWAKAFAVFHNGDVEEGSTIHDNVVWNATEKFRAKKSRKDRGRAFNAYLVSGLLNTLKNLFNKKTSHKNHPRVACQICGEKLFRIDDKHLSHRMDVNVYRRKYQRFPLSSPDGMTVCPVSGERVEEITEPYINRILGAYSMEDFYAEFPSMVPKPVSCPMTGMRVMITKDYPSYLAKGYSEEAFIHDFPECEAIITCPFTGKKMLGMTQEHLDEEFGQYASKKRVTMKDFKASYDNVTLRSRRAKVKNPYTGKMVDELTPEMLAAAGTNVKDHLGKYAKVWIDKHYQDTITCPFTGRRVKQIRHSDLEKLGRTVVEFYNAVSEYPLYQYEVQCAGCGKWVPNIWEHLESDPHKYAEPMTLQKYESIFGTNSVQAHISNNSYFENDSGDSIHIADLFAKVTEQPVDAMEIEDSLSKVVQDEMDSSLVKAIRTSVTVEDVLYAAAEKRIVPLRFKFQLGMTKEARMAIKASLGFSDFDIGKPPNIGAKEVVVMIPSRGVLRNRLLRLIKESDLVAQEEE